MSDGSKFLLFMFALIAGLAALGGGGYAVYTNYKERGIRNNNPGNLRPLGNGDKWQGESGHDNGINGPYLIFKAPEWGIRAIYKNLLTYRNKYGIDTVAGIITRWAPPTENDTAAYIDAVSQHVGKSATSQLSLDDYPAVLESIIKHENGVQPYPRSLIQQGIALA